MKIISPDKILVIVCIGLLLLLFTYILPGCTTQKQTGSSQTLADSSVLKEQQETIRVLQQDNARLTGELRVQEYFGVMFDTVSLEPQIIIPDHCNADSILRLLDATRNRVKVYADGTIEAEGKLKSAFYSKDKLSRVITDLQRINDSLRQEKQREELRYVKKTGFKEKKVKRGLFAGWWLWLIFVAGGYYVRGRFGKIFGII